MLKGGQSLLMKKKDFTGTAIPPESRAEIDQFIDKYKTDADKAMSQMYEAMHELRNKIVAKQLGIVE